MAGGAPSRKSRALAQKLAAEAQPPAVEVDLADLPAATREEFETYAIDADAVLEQRNDDGKVTVMPHVKLALKEAPTVTFPTLDGMQLRGGKARVTMLSPENAIKVGEMLVAEGKSALDSREEQPLQSENVAIASSMSDVAAAVERAAAVEKDLKGTSPQ